MDLVNEGFYDHTGRGGGCPIKLQELVAHFFVMYEDETSVAASKYVTYGVGRISAVEFVLEVRKGDIIGCAQKPQSFIAANIATVTIVPGTVIHQPMFLARRIRRRSSFSWSLTSSLSLASLASSCIFSSRLSSLIGDVKCSFSYDFSNHITCS